MSNRVDHAAEAREFMEASQLVASQHELAAADLAVKHAQVHATLAVAEQLRAASLIALSGTALQMNTDDGWRAVQQDIAAALGIGADDE